jgi:dolichol-phosphate mannosyltransferase
MNAKTVLLTGGTGFVGANLARRLLGEGHRVHLLVRERFQTWRTDGIRNDVAFHPVALADAMAVKAVLSRVRPDWVFHLAVHGAYSWQTGFDEMLRTNLHGTINLVEASLAAGTGVIVNTGSSSEYGARDHAPQETEELEPNSHYAVTKAAAVMYCRYMAQAHGARIPTLRLYSVFGPYEDPNRLLPKLVKTGLEGGLPPLADPETARDFVYVDDVVDAYLLAAAKRTSEAGAIYNVASGTETKLRQAVEIARRVMGVQAEPVWNTMPGRNWDTTVWVGNSDKLRRELNWQPRYSFEAGLRRMIDWHRSAPDAALAASAPNGGKA